MKFNLEEFLNVVSVVAPAILTLIPGAHDIAVLVPVIISAIKEAEALARATGPEKKAHALAMVDDAITLLNATGRVHLDPETAHGVADRGIDVVIGVINLIQRAHNET